MRTRFFVERSIEAAPDVVFHCLADYREHHQPGGFLPPAFSDQVVTKGGLGGGTELTFVVSAGGRRRTVHSTVSGSAADMSLVERSDGIETISSVEPLDGGARVRFETVLDERGLRGILDRLFGPRLLRPIYEEELRRLDEHARAHGPVADPQATRRGVDSIQRP